MTNYIKIHNVETGEVIEREMTKAELDKLKAEQAESLAYAETQAIKAAEKRGRGRPAGAKSGARKITGTSKLMNK